ncbi:MAG: nucleotidyltransferase domain-containing protein [Bacteroidales bacterium]|nr:DNA polymerase subunit beta [Lentimicrobiaceae bacterium]MBR6775751.1 nucleotidyltransferase domain-containing protein [Bacteroidales bacterium]
MKTRSEYISIIKSFSDVIKSQFGVSSMRLFGSVAREEQTDNSDIDLCVVMKPNMILRIRLKHFLEELLVCNVDIVREHKNMNETLKREIERDGIEIFTE